MLSKPSRYLLDVNVAVALLDEAHPHHDLAADWFQVPGRQWTLCSFTEAGVLRFFSRPATGTLTIEEATRLLKKFKELPGHHTQPIAADWEGLTRPFAKRLQGYRQITDAFLLGVAIREGLVLATFDRALLHLAAEYRQHVHLLA